MGILAGLWMSVVSAAGLPGEELLLRVGETMEVEGEDLSLRFVEVRSDSRCPKDARCIRAGEAVVVLEARASDREVRELILEIPPGGSAREFFDGLVVHVVALEPPAESGKKIEPCEYVLKVTTEKE